MCSRTLAGENPEEKLEISRESSTEASTPSGSLQHTFPKFGAFPRTGTPPGPLSIPSCGTTHKFFPAEAWRPLATRDASPKGDDRTGFCVLVLVNIQISERAERMRGKAARDQKAANGAGGPMHQIGGPSSGALSSNRQTGAVIAGNRWSRPPRDI
ncbi:hypothetical protein VTK26DRAFT_1160 [Humicola hyalothermophila]